MNYDLTKINWFSNPIWESHLNINDKEIIDYSNYLKENHSIHHKNLNQGGYQFFNIENPPASYTCLLNIIENLIAEAKKSIGIHDNCLLYIKESWINVNTPFSYNARHIHHRTLFSGVYYVQVPDGKCGDIIFHRNNLVTNYLPPYIVEQWNNMNSASVSFKPQVGMLLLFPGWLEHSVTTNLTNQDRISISFNIHYE
jgi:uncharacterized protein (TIGR02466 family)